MHISNKDIRKRARYLLDDNIFGRDWIKSVFFIIIFTSVTGFITNIVKSILDPILNIIPNFLINLGVVHNIFYIIAIVLAIYIGILTTSITTGPFSYSSAAVHLDFAREEGGFKIKRMFSGFKNHFGGNVQLSIMYTIHIGLWSLFFIIPGIYAMYSYRMIYHVKHDNPEFSWKECFDESERLMDGNRFRLFKLDCSFIGWYILGTLAGCGIGALWVSPYKAVSEAVFYDVIKVEKEEYDY